MACFRDHSPITNRQKPSKPQPPTMPLAPSRPRICARKDPRRREPGATPHARKTDAVRRVSAGPAYAASALGAVHSSLSRAISPQQFLHPGGAPRVSFLPPGAIKGAMVAAVVEARPEVDRRFARAAAGDGAAWGALLIEHEERLRRMVAFRLDPRLQGASTPRTSCRRRTSRPPTTATITSAWRSGAAVPLAARDRREQAAGDCTATTSARACATPAARSPQLAAGVGARRHVGRAGRRSSPATPPGPATAAAGAEVEPSALREALDAHGRRSTARSWRCGTSSN